MGKHAHGRIVFWEGASMWLLGTRPGEGPYPKTAFHAHHAVQVTLGLRGSFTLETKQRVGEGAVLAVAAHTEHAISGDGVVAHLYIDPDGRAGREAQRLWLDGAPISPVSAQLGELPSKLLAEYDSPSRTDAPLIDLGRAWLAQLAPEAERDERPEVRVRKMSAWAAARIDGEVTLEEAAAQVGLSQGRARHLFVQQTGLPFKTWLLWTRLMKAVELFSGGTSLTEAAHRAGFSDSSHLSRTFQRMFGITAASLRIS